MENILTGKFPDYVIKDNKIVVVSKNYFEFMAPFIKIAFGADSGPFFTDGNAYLSFSVPTQITPGRSKSKNIIFLKIK